MVLRCGQIGMSMLNMVGRQREKGKDGFGLEIFVLNHVDMKFMEIIVYFDRLVVRKTL